MTPTDPAPPSDSDDTPAPPRGVRANLLTLGSAAVLAVYTAGYVRTKAAAEQFENAESRRRVPVPDPVLPHQDAVALAAAPGPVVHPVSAPKAKPVQRETVAKDTAALPAAPAESVVAVTPTIPTTPTIPNTPDTAVAATDSLLRRFKDGRYRGWGYSQHGNIEAEIEIQGGRILTASITTCLMAWSCDAYIRHLPPQVVARQSPDVDTVSRVTQSSDAFYWAVVNALKKAE